MPMLPKDLSSKLERAVLAARDVATDGARAALIALGVGDAKKPPHLDATGEAQRRALRARGRQAGDALGADQSQETRHLVQECAYEHWHRMLFARFLAENELLLHPDMGVAVSLEECEELAREEGLDRWELAARFAQNMLPQIFRPDDPVLHLRLPVEARNKLTAILNELPAVVFTADDSLGWVYQFWRAKEKEDVNNAGIAISADTLPAVTQLFTEHYMVEFLLHNTLGAWWTAKVEAAGHQTSIPLPFLRRKDDGLQAAGAFPGWPKTVRELRVLDPSCGSGHFLVALLQLLVAMLREEEGLSMEEAVRVVLGEILHGLEIDARCTQLAAFNVAFAAWKLIEKPVDLPPLRIACCGLSVGATREEWLASVEDKDSRFLIGQLYDLFKKAPELGSLINPKRLSNIGQNASDLLPLVRTLLASDALGNPERHELGVTAKGLADAAHILNTTFHFVVTNVPYLGRGDQSNTLKDFCERYYPDSKTELATVFLERMLEHVGMSATIAVVMPRIWLTFTAYYKALREKLLERHTWELLGVLGKRAFRSISGEVVDVVLLVLTKSTPEVGTRFGVVNVSSAGSADEKDKALRSAKLGFASQVACLDRPGAVVVTDDGEDTPRTTTSLLSKYVSISEGISRGDTGRFDRGFWELPKVDLQLWAPLVESATGEAEYSGGTIFLWENGRGQLAGSASARVQGTDAWGRPAVFVSRTHLTAFLTNGAPHAQNGVAIVPRNADHLPAIWCYCNSAEYRDAVLKLNQKLIKPTGVMDQVPFDLAHWQRVADERYPDGLPKPCSDNPTQWLFSGNPRDSSAPLQVAVARLLGYRWPRQTGSEFPNCPALGSDGLEAFVDDDGIVCLTPLRGESSAADRLRELLRSTIGAFDERQIIASEGKKGSKSNTLEDWLRDEFFEQHSELFHQRPFIWHIWDGRKDGFHALVNYHKLAAPNGTGRRTLEALTHGYLGDWITRQRHAQKEGESGADDRLAASLELHGVLEKILSGEPPYDLFVRWKPLHQQPIGWDPDINDGVRLNARPFLAADLSRGKKGAGILRSKPNINWGPKPDLGSETMRAKQDFPWLWGWDEMTQDFAGGSAFDGKRWNALHYSTTFKQGARDRQKKS